MRRGRQRWRAVKRWGARGGWPLEPLGVAPRIEIVTPESGARLPVEFLVALATEDLPRGACLLLSIDVAPAAVGEPAGPSANRLLLREDRRHLMLMLDEGLHTLCAQALDPEGRVLEALSLVSIEVDHRIGVSTA